MEKVVMNILMYVFCQIYTLISVKHISRNETSRSWSRYVPSVNTTSQFSKI